MNKESIISFTSGVLATGLAQGITSEVLNIILTILSIIAILVSLVTSIVKIVKDATSDGKITVDEIVEMNQKTQDAIEEAQDALKEINKDDK